MRRASFLVSKFAAVVPVPVPRGAGEPDAIAHARRAPAAALPAIELGPDDRRVIVRRAWLCCSRHQVRWACDLDGAWLNAHSGERERRYERVSPLFFASLHPANIRVAQIHDAALPRIRAGSAARREREAKATRR